ncbi:GreA/GreB family elongation factor [Azohydromonas lata]|uniref:GreA/GreB family elongation factor n=1 Tax=Azohydromonas lata TaxID=45677 RepID=A0ABU5IQK4_9BURK|nr:GreA/GreB family elongation factor [Azohydromonas lata]MDZ5461163.1 GreA/GreB family elongation factor [Azohydromonas lata]
MNILTAEDRTLTELDHRRLGRLIHLDTHPMAAVLEEAELTPSREVPADVVTMHSRIRLADLDSGQALTLTLCYPADAEPARGFVSVLSPVGMSVLGLRVGDVARWRLPGGWEGAARVEAIEFQPEASGIYTL